LRVVQKVFIEKMKGELVPRLTNNCKGELFDISYRQGGLEVSKGNTKLDDCTLIMNMGPAETCPSKQLGFCKVGERCYARKAEKLYKHCLPYRRRQYNYWIDETANGIAAQLSLLLKRIRTPIKYLRFNESGDFHSQECVQKLSLLAEYLKKEHNITTYGYTARQDLNFENVHFLVKGSSHNSGNNGQTIVLRKNKIQNHLSTLSESEKPNWIVCPMSCRECDICKEPTGTNVIFPLH